MKTLLALWKADQPALLDGALRASLVSAGATRLQVNIDDADVARAQLRLTDFDEMPNAVVEVWGDVDVTAVTDTLAPHCESLAAWRVSSREPLVGPPVPDGERADALANVAFLRRPEDLSVEEWRSRWLDHHTTVAIETQGTFGYVQDEVLEQVAGEPLGIAAVVEELFPMEAIDDVHAFYGSGGSQAELERRMTELMASVQRFGADRGITLVPTSRYSFELSGERG